MTQRAKAGQFSHHVWEENKVNRVFDLPGTIVKVVIFEPLYLHHHL